MAVQDEYPDVPYRGVWGNSTEKEWSSISYEILWNVPYNQYIIIYIYTVGYIPSIDPYDGSYITGYQRIKDTQPDVGPTLFGKYGDLLEFMADWKKEHETSTIQTIGVHGIVSLL